MFNYYDAVKADLIEYAEENGVNLSDDVIERLYDYVTGNGQESYTCDAEEAKRNVLADFDTVLEAVRSLIITTEEVGERFLDGDWEWLDVAARCYVLPDVLFDIRGGKL